jgi:hypothetical protein
VVVAGERVEVVWQRIRGEGVGCDSGPGRAGQRRIWGEGGGVRRPGGGGCSSYTCRVFVTGPAEINGPAGAFPECRVPGTRGSISSPTGNYFSFFCLIFAKPSHM